MGSGDIALLLAEMLLYFAVMATLFRARGSLGIGVFVCSLGVIHFLETYLASVFFIQGPFGPLSPGSSVLFSGKLAMILLLYVKEDAETVRQPVYGLFLGNALVVAFCLLLRFQEPLALAGMRPDINFVDQMGVLMVWGTLLLFLDSIMLVLLYERVGGWFGRWQVARIVFALAVILSFDQLAFFAVLRLVANVPLEALTGGWAAKMGAAVTYGVLLALYLRHFETAPDAAAPRRLRDLFDLLTYRGPHSGTGSGRDRDTGMLSAARLPVLGGMRFRRAVTRGRPMALLLVQIGGLATSRMREVAEILSGALRADDLVFRQEGHGFALLLEGIPPFAAEALAETLGRTLSERLAEPGGEGPSLWIGVAPGPGRASDFPSMHRIAQASLRRRGRVAEPGPADPARA